MPEDAWKGEALKASTASHGMVAKQTMRRNQFMADVMAPRYSSGIPAGKRETLS